MKTTINVSHNGAPQTVLATPITGNELYDAFGVAAYETLYRKGHGGNADDLINRSSVDEYQVNENDVFHTEKTEPLPVVNVTLDDKAQTVATGLVFRDANGNLVPGQLKDANGNLIPGNYPYQIRDVNGNIVNGAPQVRLANGTYVADQYRDVNGNLLPGYAHVAGRVIDGNGLYLHFTVATDRTLFRKVAGSTAEQILRNTTPLTVSEGDSFYTKVS